MAASRAGLKRKGQRHDEGEMRRPSPPPAPPKPAYAPTPAEVEQVRAHAERRRARPPAQPDLFEAGSPAIDGADLGGWSRGLAPPSVVRGVRHELRRRGLRRDDLARRIGLSRAQLGNGLRGRFGLGPAAVAGLKAFLLAATAA
jgi:hypothetical protein